MERVETDNIKTYKSINIVLHFLITYSMVQSPSWEANWFAASQEIPRISRNPKVYYRTHKSPPPVSILGQPNPPHFLHFKKRLTISYITETIHVEELWWN